MKQMLSTVRRMLSMKLVCLLLGTILLLGVSASVSGQMKDEYWNQIPSAIKAHLITTGYDGSRELSIMCFALTDQTEVILGTPGMKQAAETVLSGNCFVVYAAPSGSEYFWPTGFDFTQGYSQYEVDYDDYMTISGNFSGGELKAGTVASGLIRVPDGIDPSRTFTIWYDDESASLGPIDFGAIGLGSSARLVLEVDLGHIPQTVARGDAVLIHVTTAASADCTLTLYTSNGIVESTTLASRRASSEGDVTWVWSTDSRTPLGLVMLQVTAVLDGQSADALGSFVVQDE
ncbi:hypothetical protein ACFLSF_01170 [Candidatus Bipolaricaulota bacterium]